MQASKLRIMIHPWSMALEVPQSSPLGRGLPTKPGKPSDTVPHRRWAEEGSSRSYTLGVGSQYAGLWARLPLLGNKSLFPQQWDPGVSDSCPRPRPRRSPRRTQIRTDSRNCDNKTVEGRNLVNHRCPFFLHKKSLSPIFSVLLNTRSLMLEKVKDL